MSLKFSDLKFMSIGGNCADTYFLGKDRIRGPVDNLYFEKGLENVFDVLDGKILREIISRKFEIKKSGNDTLRIYPCRIRVVHNDPFQKEYIEEFRKRFYRLINFINTRDPKNILVYTINRNDVIEDNQPFHLKKSFYDSVDRLNKMNLLNRIIFVGTKNPRKWKEWARYYSEDFKKLKVKYIEIDDIFDSDKNYNQFKNEVMKLIGEK